MLDWDLVVRRALLASLLVAFGVACAAVEDLDSDESAHTAGQITFSNDPHVWSDIDRTTFDGYTGKRSPADDEVVTKRLQAWLDRFDEAARKIAGTTLAAPKPRARLNPIADLNAFVMRPPTCATEGKAPLPLAGDVAPLTTLDSLTRRDANDKDCVTSKSWQPMTGTAYVNGLGAWKITPDGKVFSVARDGVDTERFANVAIRAAAPYISVNAGLVTQLGEKQVAAIVAHELGHYYRGHGTLAFSGKNDFWFDLNAPAAERPTPVANSADYRRQYEETKVRRFVVEGQKLSPRVAANTLKWAVDMSTSKDHPCAPAAKAWMDQPSAVTGELLADNTPTLSPDAQAVYRDFEPKMIACIDAVKLGDVDSSTMIFDTTTIPRQFFLRRIDKGLDAYLPAAARKAATLRELVDAMNVAGGKVDAFAESFKAKLKENRIGFYSDEQEADELSLELGAAIGLSPDEVIDGLHALAVAAEDKNFAGYLSNNGISTKDCDTLQKNEFKKDGQAVFVPLGNLDDPHHAFCYRLFNLSRERDVHKYSVASASFPSTTPAWTEIQAAAKDILANGVKATVVMPDAGAPTMDAGMPTMDAGTTTTPPVAPAPKPDAGTTVAKTDAGADDDPEPPRTHHATDPDEDQPAASDGEDAGTPKKKKNNTTSAGCAMTRAGTTGPSAAVWMLLGLAVLRRRRSR